MTKQISTKKFAANVIISVTAQLISLLVGFVFNLIVPKFIDEYAYSYWQMYLLYVGYVGLLHFGILDGLVLRYSQYDYDEIDRKRVRSQFILLLCMNSAFALIALISAAFVSDSVTKWIISLVGVGIVVRNVLTYTQYSFQITNRINQYAVTVLVQRLVYCVAVITLLLVGLKDFYYFCIAEISGDAAAIVVGAVFNRGMYFGKTLPLKETFRETGENIKAGVVLLIANLSASLMMGGAKMIVQWRWDDLVFGKVSFAFSLSTVFLTFVSAISVVLFPSLKRVDEKNLPDIYKNTRSAVSLLLFFALCAYFPGCFVLNKWLPKYSESLYYLGFLLPLIVFSSKISLLTNNYLKVYRKERSMMIINVVTGVFGFGLFALCAYAFNNLVMLLCSIIFVMMLNSVLSEIVVAKVINKKIFAEFIVEACMVITFMVCASVCGLLVGFLCYLAAFAVYCVINRKTFVGLFNKIKKKGAKEE